MNVLNASTILLQTAFFLVNNDMKNNTPIPVNTIEDIRKGFGEKEAVCYDDLGCFSINPPWTVESRPMSHYPQHPDVINVKFCLFTRKNPKDCQQLHYNDTESIHNSSIVATHKTYLFAHGFLGDERWMKEAVQQLLIRADVNVITVNWSPGSKPPYPQAVANIRLVGVLTAHLINTLHVSIGLKTEFLHMTGHSLGAHLSGYVGYTLQNRFNLMLGRITGLDPAKPHFANTETIVRLDPSDATYVDIIHTDATPFIQGGLGMDVPIGHFDFYPNGGETQPGCEQGVLAYIDEAEGSIVKGMKKFLNCDHVRSYDLFIESVNSKCKFLSIECDSWESFKEGKCFRCQSDINPDGRICASLGKNSGKALKEKTAPQGRFIPHTDRTHVKLYTITSGSKPYCESLFRVNITISNTLASKNHGGEIGEFSIEIEGARGKTGKIPLFKEKYFEPGTSHREVVGGKQVGRVRSAILHWDHRATINFLTWRIAKPRIHVQSVVIDNLEHDYSITLCKPGGEIIYGDKGEVLTPCGPHATRPIIE